MEQIVSVVGMYLHPIRDSMFIVFGDKIMSMLDLRLDNTCTAEGGLRVYFLKVALLWTSFSSAKLATR